MIATTSYCTSLEVCFNTLVMAYSTTAAVLLCYSDYCHFCNHCYSKYIATSGISQWYSIVAQYYSNRVLHYSTIVLQWNNITTL